MTSQSLECSKVTERLIDGERPGNDPELAEHVGSCLNCFRTASDLRGLPQLRQQLECGDGDRVGGAAGSRGLPDPGAAFWASFPDQVARAWESAQTQAAAPATTPMPAREASSRWRKAWQDLVGLLRMPVPAACAGALGAAVIVMTVLGQGQVNRARPDLASGGKTGEKLGNPIAEAEEGVAALLPAGLQTSALDDSDESIRALDVTGLLRMRSQLDETMASDAGKRAPAEADGPGQPESNPTALADELDELSDAGLARLSENLGDTI